MNKIYITSFLILGFFTRCDNKNNQINNETFLIHIQKTWYEEPNGFSFPIHVKVPTKSMPKDGYPACILLHGNGGNGLQTISEFSNVLNDHILVAPTGYRNSWNLCDEKSNAPDIEMINELVIILQEYPNLNPNKIRVLGLSNGAGLANSVFIENKNEGIDIVVAIVSHLNEPQYHQDNFYKIGNATDPSLPFCGYDETENPLSTRKYVSISNNNDPIIPYAGGASTVGLNFLNAETAIYLIAKNQGYEGSVLSTGVQIGNTSVFKYSYLQDKVVHLKGNTQHSINQTQRDFVRNFFSE